MACYHPLKAIQIPGETINHKPRYRIVPYYTETDNFIEIPCGQCIGCRLKYSRMWADRCLAEATLHEQSYFVTLTYDNDHLPYNIDKETGEISKYPTLSKRDVQLFMKRLRKDYKYENKIRFFLAGEYGSQTARPHYHLIIFGLRLDDTILYKRTSLGFNLYNSEFINSIWGKGHVVIAEVTWETCAYTARYIMKKQTGTSSEKYKTLNIIPEFTLMSRKPGIAKEFYEQNKLDFLRYGGTDISTPKGGRKIHNTKYFDKFLELEYPEEKEQKKILVKEQMEVIKQSKMEKTSLSYLEMLEVQEEVKKKRMAFLPRKEI